MSGLGGKPRGPTTLRTLQIVSAFESAIVEAVFAKDVVEVLTKKPIVPGEEEMRANPRSRSSKLRAAEKLENES